MALLMMLLRKMGKNRWLAVSLLSGTVLCVALTSSIPAYKDAILQRMLVKEMDQFYVQTGEHPGKLSASVKLEKHQKPKQSGYFRWLDAYWDRHVAKAEGFDAAQHLVERKTSHVALEPVDPAKVDPQVDRQAYIAMRTGLKEKVRLKDGRMPASEPVDGVFEALVTDEALTTLNMVLENEFFVGGKSVQKRLRIKPVGVMAPKDELDEYWNLSPISRYDRMLIIDGTLFEKVLLDGGELPVDETRWHIAYDYRAFELDSATGFLAIKDETELLLKSRFSLNASVSQPAGGLLSGYGDRERALRMLLWSLNVPMYGLIAFYLYMLSHMLVERQKAEIAVLKSRGASRLQITAIFAAESAIISSVALLIGPFVGLWFTKLLGSSSTFMNFVQRKAMLVEMNGESLLYAAGAALIAFAINLIPVFAATRADIVDQKRQSARQDKQSFWHLFGLDIIFLALAFYGLQTFRSRMKDLTALGLDGKDISVDPLLFAVPSMYIFGSGLLLLRLYPLLVRFFFWIGRSFWPPSLYASLLLVGRHNAQYQTIMLFLLLTLGTGIFNASAARTLNTNIEDQLWYRYGSDVVLRQHWYSDAPAPVSTAPGQQSEATSDDSLKINYQEPPFELFDDLPGVQQAARVFIKEKAMFSMGLKEGNVRLIGIDTDDFGRTAWMKGGLLPFPFYRYLNAIASDPNGVLISKTLADRFDIKPGDMIDIGWYGTDKMTVGVYAIIQYFPTFNPNPVAEDKEKKAVPPMLVVGNLNTIQNRLATEPYEVWIKLSSNASRSAFYDALQKNNIEVIKMDDIYEKIADSRNDPFRMAMNGAMSLGFMLSLCLSFTGFILYWTLSLKGRMLQLGLFRAMGISFPQMIGMLGAEQLLTSGAGFATGLLTGVTASLVFVPMFQLAFDPGKIVPPFRILIEEADLAQMLALTMIMLAAALAMLSLLLKRMKIAQAVKLGEE